MDQTVEDFHIILPSNASMEYFPDNTPDHYRTKLAYPIQIDDRYECALVEASVPGKFFTIHTDYNDQYTIEKKIAIEDYITHVELYVDLYNPTESDFIKGVNENIKNAWKTAPLDLSIKDRKLWIVLKKGWDLHISASRGNQFLRLLNLDPDTDYVTEGTDDKFHTVEYRVPDRNVFRNQFIKLVARNPVQKFTYEIVLDKTVNNDITFERVNKILYNVVGSNIVNFHVRGGKITLNIKKHIDLLLNRKTCPKLMDSLNIKSETHLIRSSEEEIQFDFTPPAESLDGEKFKLIVNEQFPITRYEQKIRTYKIPPGMYRDSLSFFAEFKEIFLKELPDAKTKLSVPKGVVVEFGEKLLDILGFTRKKFSEGNYVSDYNLELSAGITEIYVYTDIVFPSLVGDVSTSILKIIPIGNERGEQIVKYFPVPIYFPVKKQYFDVIEIELRTSSGSKLKFLSGKSYLVLSFRKKKI